VNLQPALDKLHIPWCQIDLPDHATGDVQVNGEYVVYAIRTMHSRAGRRISTIGHSQGGMLPRSALRFWPDTRAMVDDVIGFAPSNHGTTQAKTSCGDGKCSAADWQQWDISKFVKALNSRAETWKGVSYTSVYTHTDEIVQPNLDDKGSSSLHTGAGRIENVATQDVCPNDANEHLLVGLIDPVAYALAVDALQHAGPADPKRVAKTVCAQTFHPGINPVTFPADGSAAAADFESYNAAEVSAEPPLACYTTASCPATNCTKRTRFSVGVRPLRDLLVTLAGRRLTVHRRGTHPYVVVDLRPFGTRAARLHVTGRDRSGRKVTIARTYRHC
jgi:hypothetical protein